MKETEAQYLARLAYHSAHDLLDCIDDAVKQMIESRNWKTYLTTLDLFTVLHLKARMNTFKKAVGNNFELYIYNGDKYNDRVLEYIVNFYNDLIREFRKDIINLFNFCRKDVPHLTGNGEESFLALTYGGYIR